MAKQSKIDKVLDHLLSGRDLTKAEAAQEYRTNNLESIIKVLRKRGYNIPPAEMRLNLNTNEWYGEYMLIM